MLKLLNEFLAVESMWYFQEKLSDKYTSKDVELTEYIDKLHSIIEEQRRALRTLCKRIKKYKVISGFEMNLLIMSVVFR